MKANKSFTKLAEKVEKLAIYSAVETVGKSFPLTMHEVELPADLRTKILNRKNGWTGFLINNVTLHN